VLAPHLCLRTLETFAVRRPEWTVKGMPLEKWGARAGERWPGTLGGRHPLHLALWAGCTPPGCQSHAAGRRHVPVAFRAGSLRSLIGRAPCPRSGGLDTPVARALAPFGHGGSGRGGAMCAPPPAGARHGLRLRGRAHGGQLGRPHKLAPAAALVTFRCARHCPLVPCWRPPRPFRGTGLVAVPGSV
jgi:hypothetical protein